MTYNYCIRSKNMYVYSLWKKTHSEKKLNANKKKNLKKLNKLTIFRPDNNQTFSAKACRDMWKYANSLHYPHFPACPSSKHWFITSKKHLNIKFLLSQTSKKATNSDQLISFLSYDLFWNVCHNLLYVLKFTPARY